jgi:diadenosine tetraphosphate (Ap4A) HIT family hydrolase
MHECCLCSQIEGRPEHDLIARLLPNDPYTRRIPIETPHFAVIPSLGPLAEGHVLLCPKQHLKSFSELPVNLDSEYLDVCTLIEARLRATYAPQLVVFEHGMAVTGGRVPCSVEHAHKHFVPLLASTEPVFEPRLRWRAYDGSPSALRALTAGREYISMRDTHGKHQLLLSEGAAFESQYMRRVLAASLGCTHWNWREVPNPQAVDAVWQKLSSQSHSATAS